MNENNTCKQAASKLTEGKKRRKNLPHNLCNELNNNQNLTFEDPHPPPSLSLSLSLSLSVCVNAEPYI